MAILQVRDVEDQLYEALKARAKKERRSISQEVVKILETYLTQVPQTHLSQAEALLALADAWSDDRPAEEIIKEIKEARRDSDRFEDADGLFD